MSEAPHLFFYGVLMEQLAQWPFLCGLGAGRPATTRGTLHAIPDPDGWYPALTAGERLVHGMVHDAGRVNLAAIDAFEGANYTRTDVRVDVAGQTLAAHAYVWTAPLPENCELISNGDFARWIEENRYPVFQST